MTTLLGLDTSAALCSVAIYREGRLIEHTRLVERMHNTVVLEMVDDLWRREGMEKGQLDVVAFSCGPGSFTGVRIAASVAQGIAFANDARICPVSSSLALASAALPLADFLTADGVLTAIRSRRNAFYLAGYALQGGELSNVMEDHLVDGDDPPNDLKVHGWLLVGDEPPWWRRVPDLVYETEPKIEATVVCELGMRQFERGESLDVAAGLPVYISGDSPWQPKNG